MALRTFTVFQDAPPSDSPAPIPAPTPKPRVPSANTAILGTSSSVLANANGAHPNGAATLTTAEKENLHPLTGERTSSTTASKKRKTAVLTTKVHPPLGAKAHKEAPPEAKKRKSSSSSSAPGDKAKPKSSSSSKKDKTSGSTRKAAKKPSRRVSPLPRVHEEPEAEPEHEHERLAQAGIDARCYELTVQPLADVSQAYEQSASLGALPPCGESKLQRVKASSVEPEIRDFFSSPPVSAAACPATIGRSALPGLGLGLSDGGEQAFSTPERKKIYAAFTFTSPSPTGERFSRAKRAGSVPRLELV